MAVNKVPVLKRCRSLGLEPSYLGYDKKSNRELKRANKKMSEYGLQLEKNRKLNSSMVFWKNLSITTMRELIR